MQWILYAVVFWGAAMAVLVLLSWRRPELGPLDGKLRPCGKAPNCVCSQHPDASRAVPPLACESDPAAEFRRLRDVVETMPQVALVEARPGYVRYEFSTRLMRFVDDVEFLLDPEARVIHVRSASRVGYSDSGVNRKRVEEIRARFEHRN